MGEGMKLAVSQLAWKQDDLDSALKLLQQSGFAGVEILPTMFVGENPYNKIERAIFSAKRMQNQYGLTVCSMQSIWYGQSGQLFNEKDQFDLLAYTEQAVLFAEAIGARNLVFGSPKNRILPEGKNDNLAIDFFDKIGTFASERGCVFSLEANPSIYGTNYMNTTKQALQVVERVANNGCKVNLDVGTMLTNQESVKELKGHVVQIAHVHISEPALAPIATHETHKELAHLLREENYTGYISIEMKSENLQELQAAIGYVAEVFG